MRERVLNWIGIGLLAVSFLVALGRIAFSGPGRTQDGQKRVEIRFCHWQLESGVREALDAIAREYEKLHPDVRITQIPIPEKIYRNWLLTQLIGGTAPDIIQIGMGVDLTTNVSYVARYFWPLADLMKAPNPHNAGTPLDGVPLRNTFFDAGAGGFSPVIFEYFGVPLSAVNVRTYYNRDLLVEITGSPKPPETYDEFLAVAEQAKEWGRRHGRTIIPMAGSRYNGPLLMARLLTTQTQKLRGEISTIANAAAQPEEVARFLLLENGLDSKPVRDGVETMREVGLQMQPGFIQALRDDATFLFAQGKSLAITSGSWDATGIRKQAPFPVVVANVPVPAPNDPRFGGNILGRASEAGSQGQGTFGVTRGSKHPETAMDFLLFMVSMRGQEIWTQTSGWLPSVVGVEPSEESKPFLPLMDGFPTGFELGNAGQADVARVMEKNFHKLVSPTGSVEAYLGSAKQDLPGAVLSDLRRSIASRLTNARRADTTVGVLFWEKLDANGAGTDAELDLILEGSNVSDRAYYRGLRGLTTLEPAQ